MTHPSIYLIPTANVGAKIDLAYGLFPEMLEHKANSEYHSELQDSQWMPEKGNPPLQSALNQLESRNKTSIESWLEIREHHTENEIQKLDSKPPYLWEIRGSVAERFDVEQGDWLLFYTGDSNYSVAAQVEYSLQNSESISFLWPSSFEEYISDQYSDTDEINIRSVLEQKYEFIINEYSSEFGEILITRKPLVISLSGKIIQGVDRRKRDFVQGFSVMDPATVDVLFDKFGSIEKFLESTDEKRASELGFRFTPEIRRYFNRNYDVTLKPGFGQQTLTGESPFAFSLEGDYKPPRANTERLVRTLNEERSLVLLGPPLTGKQRVFDAVRSQWAELYDESDLVERRRLTETDLSTRTESSLFDLSDDGLTVRGLLAEQAELAASEQNLLTLKGEDDIDLHYLHVFHNASGDVATNLLAERAGLFSPDRRGRDSKTSIGNTSVWLPEALHVGVCVDSKPSYIEELPSAVRRHFEIRRINPDVEHAMDVCGFETDGSLADELESLAKSESEWKSYLALSIATIYVTHKQLSQSGMGLGYHGLFEFKNSRIEPVIAGSDDELRKLTRRWRDMIIPEIRSQVEDDPATEIRDNKTIFSFDIDGQIDYSLVERILTTVGQTGIDDIKSHDE